MKEHDDDVLPTVKESTTTADSTTADDTVTVRGKIEGLFGEKDEGEDMVVDVVGADVVVDDAGDTKVDSEGKVGVNGSMEEGSKTEIEASDMDVDEVRVVEEVTVTTEDSVEVVVSDEGVKTTVEVSNEVIQKNVVTTTVSEVKDNNEVTERDSTEKIMEQHTESSQELEKTTEKESDVSNSLNFPESSSRDAHVAAVKEGLFGKEEGEDVVDNQVSSTEAVITGSSEDNVNVSTKNSDQQPEVDQTKEISQPTIEVSTTDVQEVSVEVLDSTKISDSETKVVEEGLTESVQEVADVDILSNEKDKKDEVLDSTKIPESESKVDDVAVDESQDVTLSSDAVNAENLDQKSEAQMEKKEDTSSHSTTEVKTVNDEKTEKEVEVHIMVDQKPEVDQILNVDTTSHADYGEDAGMDIDEVLGWKDEIPGIDPLTNQEKDQDFKITNLEISKPLVYERRVHVPDDIEDHTDFCRQQETESEPLDQSTDDVINKDLEASVSFHQPSYFHSPEQEGNFSPSDLVWGKVRSHPWWPGQIFDPSDASDKAMKYHKKDRFLVAYFGDRTFAWNDSTVLKPFRAKFSQIEKHTNSESFNNALHCALEEVSRRVELGLACNCTPHDILKKIECQIVENAGVKKESSKRYGNDKTTLVSSFEPDKLIDYVRLLAKSPYSENDKMDLVMAKAQLLSCARFKGYRQLSEYQHCGTLLEDNSLLTPNVDHVFIKKELSIDPTYYPGDTEEASRKRKASDSNHSDVSEKRPTLELATSSPKPSFKIGALIQKAANQLSDKNTEPVDLVNVSNSVNTVNTQANLPDMLSQLQLTAQDPMKGYGFLNTIIPFFYSHRAAVFSKSLKQTSGRVNNEVSRKRKPSNENDPEDFEFDDVNDSYWTDRIIQNHPEDLQIQQQLSQSQLQSQPQVHGNENGGAGHEIVAYEEKEKPVKQSRRSNKKRFFSSNHEIEAKEQTELMERRRMNLATEVLMKFNEGIYFPSEIHLNKMFRRFGPLMESETEVDRGSGKARVVFKKCSDAEVAHSSAGKFSIFGSIGVSYELNYTPLISYKPLPLPIAHEVANGEM